jgi:hypothetical protein
VADAAMSLRVFALLFIARFWRFGVVGMLICHDALPPYYSNFHLVFRSPMGVRSHVNQLQAVLVQQPPFLPSHLLAVGGLWSFEKASCPASIDEGDVAWSVSMGGVPTENVKRAARRLVSIPGCLYHPFLGCLCSNPQTMSSIDDFLKLLAVGRER